MSPEPQYRPVFLPSRKCPTPGCPNLTRSGKCPDCTKAEDHRRGHSRERGYTRLWEKQSLLFRKQNPLCMDPFNVHSRDHRVEPSRVTDHIVPHNGNRFLFRDPSNLGALCVSCHNQKTFLESRGQSVIYQRLSREEIQQRALVGWKEPIGG